MAVLSFAAKALPPSIPAQSLADALVSLAMASSLEIVVDPQLVAHKRAPAVRDARTPEDALDRLLKGSNLTYRRLAGATFVITAVPPVPTAAKPPAPLADQAIAEILVVGRNSQNTDIRRSPDDIQPYQVADSAAIERAQPGSIDDYLRNYLSSNTQAFPLSERSSSARSQIDLRGLGTAETLALVDGRRLASIPAQGDFLQSDLNALPVGGIARIESLGSTAGGIFGIGAAGGAVNVVMKRDFQGLDIGVDHGISDRGDASSARVEAHFGYTSPGGHTHFMVRSSYSRDAGLLVGDRPYTLAARELRNALVPGHTDTLVANAIDVRTTSGEPLSLIPSLGGASLGASTTYLPIGSPALSDGGLAILQANAGRYDLSLSPDAQGALASLVARTHSYSVVSTLRQKVGSRVVLFVDYLRLVDWGRSMTLGYDLRGNVLEPGMPGNPFNEEVAVTFPTPSLIGIAQERATTDRITAGAIVSLPYGWTANLDGSISHAALRTHLSNYGLTLPIDAFSGPSVLAGHLANATSDFSQTDGIDHLYDGNLRLAGPLIRLPGGRASMTVTGEYRRETSPGLSVAGVSGPFTLIPSPRPQRQDVGSVFAEARLPLVPRESALLPLRGLELQVAVRGDHYTISVPEFIGLLRADSHDTVAAVTLGAKVTPIDGLTLRASYATGAVPPTPGQIIPFTSQSVFFDGFDDPRRGGAQVGGEPSTLQITSGGNPDLRPQPARTFTAGAIVQPATIKGLRISIDYGLIILRHQLTGYAQNDLQYFIDNEALYPDRVTRSPLTPEDIAAGFTGGQIIAVDESLLNTGHSSVQTVDFSLDYRLATSAGIFRAFGQATWEPVFRHRDVPGQPAYNLVGHLDGPLAWRGSGGIQWTNGSLSLGLDAQIFAGYKGADATRILDASLLGSAQTNQSLAALQKMEPRIPPQVYIDFTAGFRRTLRISAARTAVIEYRLGVKNITDKHPPVVVNIVPGTDSFVFDAEQNGSFSPYGDPRGRRFQISATVSY